MDQKDVLKRLLEFYKKKNNKSYNLDFVKAVMDLVKCGDIEEDVFYKFCDENDIDPLRAKGLKAKNRNITSWKDYTKSSC